MKISIEIPPEMEKPLMEKCSKSGVSPAEFIYHLLDWYFFKRKKKGKSELALEVEQLLKFAKEASMERVKYCRFSDGVHCGKELLESDLFSEDKESEPISPYRCLFCPHFIDRREEDEIKKIKMLKLNGSISEIQLHDLARIAAKYVVEMYADKIIKALQTKSEEKIEEEMEFEMLDL